MDPESLPGSEEEHSDGEILLSLKYVLKPSTSLLPHQLSAIRWAAQGTLEMEGGAILADDMGLGKTLSALCMALRGFQQGDKRRVLVVCPISTLENWGREVKKYFRAEQDGGPRVYIYKKEKYGDFDRSANIVIVNKDKLCNSLACVMEYGWLFMGLKKNALAQLFRYSCYEKIKREYRKSFTVLAQSAGRRTVGNRRFDAQKAFDAVRANFKVGCKLPYCVRPVSVLHRTEKQREEAEEQRNASILRRSEEREEAKSGQRRTLVRRAREKRIQQGTGTLEDELFSEEEEDESDDSFSSKSAYTAETDSESESDWGGEEFACSVSPETYEMQENEERGLEEFTGVDMQKARTQPALFCEKWDMVLFDEGHFAKNPDTKVARAALCLCAKKKLVLSGTPMQNSVSDLLMALLLVGCKDLVPFNEWNKVLTGGRYVVTLRKRFALRRIKRPRGCEETHVGPQFVDVDIGKKYSYHLRVPFRTIKEVEIYTKRLREAEKFFLDSEKRKDLRKMDRDQMDITGENRSVSHVFSMITACRCCCIAPALMDVYKKRIKDNPRELERLDPCEYLQSTKMYYFRKYVEKHLLPVDTEEVRIYLGEEEEEETKSQAPTCDEKEPPAPMDTGDEDFQLLDPDRAQTDEPHTPQHKSKKVLVFSTFVGSLEMCELILQEMRIGYVLITGKSRTTRQSLIDSFKGDPRVQIALISLKACSEGVNLPEASRVLFLDPWWNYSTEEQAVARAHRMGQAGDVRATWLLIRGTIEEAMHDVAMYKELSARRTMEDVGSINMEDLEMRAARVLGGRRGLGDVTRSKTSMKSVYDSARNMRKLLQIMESMEGVEGDAELEKQTQEALECAEKLGSTGIRTEQYETEEEKALRLAQLELYEPYGKICGSPHTALRVLDDELDDLVCHVREHERIVNSMCIKRDLDLRPAPTQSAPTVVVVSSSDESKECTLQAEGSADFRDSDCEKEQESDAPEEEQDKQDPKETKWDQVMERTFVKMHCTAFTRSEQISAYIMDVADDFYDFYPNKQEKLKIHICFDYLDMLVAHYRRIRDRGMEMMCAPVASLLIEELAERKKKTQKSAAITPTACVPESAVKRRAPEQLTAKQRKMQRMRAHFGVAKVRTAPRRPDYQHGWKERPLVTVCKETHDRPYETYLTYNQKKNDEGPSQLHTEFHKHRNSVRGYVGPDRVAYNQQAACTDSSKMEEKAKRKKTRMTDFFRRM